MSVDGPTGDWVPLGAAVNDNQGDHSTSFGGDDLEAVYLAHDTTHLYVLLKLYEDANEYFGNGPCLPK